MLFVRCAALAAFCSIASAQTEATPAPAFEVASVKPTTHGRDAQGWSHSFVDIPSPERLQGQNASLRELVEFARS